MRALNWIVIVTSGFLLNIGFSGCDKPDFERDGGTRLGYEVDDSGQTDKYSLDDLVAAVKRRVDPNGRSNILVRPVGKNRVEVCIPRMPAYKQRVREIKQLLATMGLLEFLIVANPKDDEAGIEAAKKYFATTRKDSKVRQELERLANKGAPPPPLHPPKGESWPNGYTYSWVELGRLQRAAMKLNNAAADDPEADTLWKKLADARQKSEHMIVTDQYCLFSRPCQSQALSAQEREQKKYDYFALCRDPLKDPSTGEPMRITNQYIAHASRILDNNLRPVVALHFNKQGGERFHELTSKNQPSEAGEFYRQLAIILEGQIVSTPRLNAIIRQDATIQGNFTQEEVDRYVAVLSVGALPVPLKPMPVIEEEITPKKD